MTSYHDKKKEKSYCNDNNKKYNNNSIDLDTKMTNPIHVNTCPIQRPPPGVAAVMRQKSRYDLEALT